MKISKTKVLLDRGQFQKSELFKTLNDQIINGILSVTWADQREFIINPTIKGNGVNPIKNNFIASLLEDGWEVEKPLKLIDGIGPGPIDGIFRTNSGLVVVEWETGNISSSHRALNKIALGIIQKQIVAGFLILPLKTLAKYLTDRIGNYEELSPYFPLYERIIIDNGYICILGIEHDSISNDVILIPKGKDGNSK